MLTPSSPSRWSRLLTAVVIVLGMPAYGTSLYGQTFQYHYGNPVCRDAGRSVVKVLSINSGNLTVGESFSGIGCVNTNVYVVCTNTDGSLRWSNTYDLQGTDSATDVVACGNGDFVITGTTTGSSGSHDLFLLRISATGAMLNVYVFGRPDDEEYGLDVIEASFGDNMQTFPGDIVVAGWHGPLGKRNPLILRTTANLTFVTAGIFNGFVGDTTNKDDYFLAIVEAQTNPGAGDLIAVGGTNTVGAGNTDIFLSRQNTVGVPLATKVIGGPDDDEAQSVMEVTFGNNIGDIAIAGSTRSRPNSLIPNLDAYVLQTSSNFGVLRGDVIFGHLLRNDELFSISPDLYASPDRAAMIVTGYTSVESGTLTKENVLLQRIAGGGGALLGAGKLYGGSGDDRGYDIARPVPFVAVNPPETVGYVVSGYTRSPDLIGGDPEQLYLIKADTFLTSGCNEADVLFGPTNPPWNLVNVLPIGLGYRFEVPSAVTRNEVTWATLICGNGGGGHRIIEGGDEGGVAGIDISASMPQTASALIFPNPLREGDLLNLRFDLAEPSPATIVVTDMLGRTIARHDMSLGAGSVLAGVPTEGWGAGAYIVKIVAGNMVRECKVVIGR